MSTVIPCYNGSQFLKATLESILDQTLRPVEILVVDDGSTDSSAAIAEMFAPLVRVIRQTNQGESVARNRGIEEAQGEWVAFCDADDLWLPTKLEKQVNRIDKDSIAVCTGFSPFVGAFHSTLLSNREAVTPTQDSLTIEFLLKQGLKTHMSSLMVRKDCSVRFPIWTQYSEDLLYLFDLIRYGKISFVPEVLVYYRKHPNAQSSKQFLDTKWHESKLKWLGTVQTEFDPARVDLYRELIDRALLDASQHSVYQRNWHRLRLIQDYVKQTPNYYKDEILRMPKLPRFLYRLRDLLTRFRSR